MTLQEFINKWNNKKMEVVDSTNYAQCFDLVLGWTDNLSIPRVFPHLYAYQIYTAWSGEKLNYFDRIPNTPEAVPQAGDIPVWSSGYGPAGHTAVATGVGNTSTFQAFSQNDPVGSPCVLRTYNYNHVLGWLRAKKQDPLQECLTQHSKLVIENLDLKERVKGLEATEKRLIKEKDLAIQEAERKYSALSAVKDRECQSKINEIKVKIKNYIDSV